MKLNAYISGARLETLRKRVAEDGVSVSEWITEAVNMRLALDGDPVERTPKKTEPEYGNLVQRSLGMPHRWWVLLGIKSDEDGYPSMMACLRELVRVYLGEPVPEKVVRAPRDRELSEDARMGYYQDSYTPVRNLRSQPKEEKVPIEDWVEATPVGAHQVCECFVPGCDLHLVGLHKHNNGQLGTWVRWMRGDIDLDRRTGKWSEKDG